MIRECRSCGAPALRPVVSLGSLFLSDFRDDDSLPPAFELNTVICEWCSLVQLTETIPRELMYHERYGFKSGVNNSIRSDHWSTVKDALSIIAPSRWLDIACNDGTLLSMVPKDVERVGVDPVKKYADEAREHATSVVNDFFHPDLVDGVFDVITSISVFYDLDDPNEFVGGVKKVLAPNGVWVIQQNYWLDSVELFAIDNVCHEHITYFTLASLQHLLERHGLEVFRVKRSMVNGGSIRTFVAHKGAFPVDGSVAETLLAEKDVASPGAIERFRSGVEDRLRELHEVVRGFASEGPVYLYGASTRGNTLWQAASIGGFITAAVERNPEKVGKRIASINVPIISEQQAREDHPVAMLVSPWFFRDEFIARESAYLARGGKFIFPLPHVEVYP